MTEREYEEKELQGEIMTLAEQTLSAIPVVQAFSREPHEDTRFRALAQRTVRAHFRSMVAQLQFQVSAGATTAIGTAGILMMGGLHVLDGSLSVGSLLIFLFYPRSVYGPLQTLAFFSSTWASAEASARRISQILEIDERIEDPVRPLRVHMTPGNGQIPVSFEKVTFGYEQGRPVLNNVTFEVRAGETVAVVGPTGAGKSTLASLIPRLYDPWKGRVTLGGIDVRDFLLRELRDHVSIVLQDPFLLPLTIAENIAYGCPNASLTEIHSAAKAARADEFIRSLPNGYGTALGEEGVTLSGGERQRLAIARAILKDAPIVILDEPTSNLDLHTEASLVDGLEELIADKTTIIIAHRYSAIRHADRIIVLKEGRVIESDTQEKLMRSKGFYSSLYRTQIGWRAELPEAGERNDS